MSKPSRPFAAMYTGLCTGCGWDIEKGDEIVMLNGDPYHNDAECLARG